MWPVSRIELSSRKIIKKNARSSSLLLIDDIYDSGYLMREVAQTLMRAGAKIVYPFTITRTAHSDDQ